MTNNYDDALMRRDNMIKIDATYFFEDTTPTIVKKELSPHIVIDTIRNFIANQYEHTFNAKPDLRILQGLLNGFICATLIFCIAYVFENALLGFIVSISLFVVIVFAGVMGTVIPLILDKYDIDPALATGPFITTLNDVLGLFIYFSVGMAMYSA